MVSGWRRHLDLLAIAACLVAASATAAGAEDFGKTWEVGAHVLHTAYDNDSLLKDTFGYGVRGAYHFTNAHTVELTIEKEHTDNADPRSDVTYDLLKWTVSYLHGFKAKKPDTKLSPFLLFGIGKFDYKNDSGSDSSTTFSTGGGLRVILTKRVLARFGARVWHFRGDRDIVPRAPFFALDLTAGVSFVLGGPSS